MIMNKGNTTLDSVRLMLSPEIERSFYIDRYSIGSIEPNGNATVSIKLIGKPNKDVYGQVTAYDGEIMVMSPNVSPVMLHLKINAMENLNYQAFMGKVEKMAQERYARISSTNLSAIISKLKSDEKYGYEVSTSNGGKVVKSSSNQTIAIKNISDQTIRNVRIALSQVGKIFLLENQTISSIAPKSEVVVHLASRIDESRNHEAYSGELIIAPVNGKQIVLPIDIPAVQEKNDEFDLHLMSGSDSISYMLDKIIIRNNTTRTMDSVKIIVPKDFAKAFDLSNDSFQSVPAGNEVSVDLKFRLYNLISFTNSYSGDLIIASEHHNTKVIPINMVWSNTSSEHFTIYARNDEQDLAKAKQLRSFLESKYHGIAERFGVLNSKTIIYMLPSLDELKLITDDAIGYHYSYRDDIAFISSSNPDEAAMHVFVYRSIMKNNPSYWNKEKIMFDKGNWLIDGITNYVVSNMTGKNGLTNSELDALAADPILEWYNDGTLANYASTYTFFKFIEERYGSQAIYKIIEYMASGMVSNHRCDTLENCTVLRAVYDASGMDMKKSYKHDLDVKGLMKEWEDYVMQHYKIAIKHE